MAKKKQPADKSPWKARFLEALSKTGIIAHACTASGVHRAEAIRLRDEDEEFRARWDEAVDHSVDLLEAELYRRAVVGVETAVFKNGRKVGTVRRTSDTLLAFLVKANRPEKYRDSFDLKKLLDEIEEIHRTTPGPGTGLGDEGDRTADEE